MCVCVCVLLMKDTFRELATVAWVEFEKGDKEV